MVETRSGEAFAVPFRRMFFGESHPHQHAPSAMDVH
jgi:hypothetical protein